MSQALGEEEGMWIRQWCEDKRVVSIWEAHPKVVCRRWHATKQKMPSSSLGSSLGTLEYRFSIYMCLLGGGYLGG